MTSAVIPPQAFEFFAGLSANNNRDWYLANKPVYESKVKIPFVSLLEEVSLRLAGETTPLRGGAGTIFRLNRDVRFSHDKSPYKTHIAGLLTESGSKDPSAPLVYLHLESSGGFLAAGLWQPDTENLRALRNRMIEDETGFSQLVRSLADNGLQFDRSEATKMMPRGFSDFSEHPHSDFVRLKNLIVRSELPVDLWVEENIVDTVVNFVHCASPLLRFLRD
jgi:uncharacterized protein (TIGR02453 family)